MITKKEAKRRAILKELVQEGISADTGLGAGGAKAGVIISHYLPNAWPSLQLIAEKTKRDRRTAIRHVQELEERGIYDVHRQVNRNNRYIPRLRGTTYLMQPGDTGWEGWLSAINMVEPPPAEKGGSDSMVSPPPTKVGSDSMVSLGGDSSCHQGGDSMLSPDSLNEPPNEPLKRAPEELILEKERMPEERKTQNQDGKTSNLGGNPKETVEPVAFHADGLNSFGPTCQQCGASGLSSNRIMCYRLDGQQAHLHEACRPRWQWKAQAQAPALSLDEAFAQFYAAYPRKGNKVEAFEAYKRARQNGVTHSKIMTGLERFARRIKTDEDLRYAPGATKWLDDDGYEDQGTYGVDWF